jgi:O-antigen/teichoic acid export membrane protein
MSMAWVILGFAQTFADMGMSNALVQKQDATPRQLSSVYWLNVAMGLALAAAVWLSTPLIIRFYREPAIAGIIPWLAVSFVVTSCGQQFRMLAQRDMLFHLLAAAEISAIVAGACVSIGSALAGAGPYSLAFGGLASASVRASVLMINGWRAWHPTRHFQWLDLKQFLRFGVFQLGDKTANYIWSNVDYLAVGRFLGADALGTYRLAYELVVRPLATINPIVNTVAFPIFAKKQHDDEALRRGMLEIVRLISTLAFPVVFGLIAVAPLAVLVVFGPKWAAAAPLVQILGLLGAMRSLGNPVGSLLMAKGRVDTGFYWTAGLAVVSTVTFWLVAPLGMRPLCWSEVALLALQGVSSWKQFYYDTILLSVRAYCKAFLPALLLSTFMAIVVLGLDHLIRGLTMPPAVRLSALVMCGGVCYVGLCSIFARDYTVNLKNALASRGGR